MKMNKMFIMSLLSSFLFLSAFSCGGGTKTGAADKANGETAVSVPLFDADSAYLYIKSQVDFGPRVPNTKGHVACGNYLAGRLEKFGAQVTNQYADLIAYDGTLLKARNIIGSYKPETKSESRSLPIGIHALGRITIPTRSITGLLFWERTTARAGWGFYSKLPVSSIRTNRSWGLTLSFWMPKTTELRNSTKESTAKMLGASERNIGHAIRTCRDITPVSESCSTWWEAKEVFS